MLGLNQSIWIDSEAMKDSGDNYVKEVQNLGPKNKMAMPCDSCSKPFICTKLGLECYAFQKWVGFGYYVENTMQEFSDSDLKKIKSVNQFKKINLKSVS